MSPDFVHAQTPRINERCAELGRYGRLAGSLRFPVARKLRRPAFQRKFKRIGPAFFISALFSNLCTKSNMPSAFKSVCQLPIVS